MGGGNGMEWKRMKRIILEYSSIPLFGSLMEGMKSPFSCLRVYKGRELNGIKWNDHKGMEMNWMEWNVFKWGKGMEWNWIK